MLNACHILIDCIRAKKMLPCASIGIKDDQGIHHLTLHCLLRPSSTFWQRLAMFGAVLANLLNKLAVGTGIFTTSFTTKAA